jgi:hypothetical protein
VDTEVYDIVEPNKPLLASGMLAPPPFGDIPVVPLVAMQTAAEHLKQSNKSAGAGKTPS